jgi:hypothetical protein
MSMAADYIRTYLLHGLRASPQVIAHLLSEATPADYDRRPDPERFTIREVVAHLADWEGVWLERAGRIVREDNPTLPSYDEGQWAIDHNYAALDVADQLEKFRAGRASLADFLAGLTAEQWERTAAREFGRMTLFEQTAMVLGHDGYHFKQICDWLNAGA